jgi:hypothetical protein
MPITPIEVVTMAPKSQEASVFKHQEVQKTFNDQAIFNSEFKQEIQHNNNQTVKTSKGENKEYRYDAKEKGNNSYMGKKQKKKQKENESDKKGNIQSGSIDIRI